MSPAAGERHEIWLRGNLRPALGLALAATGVAGAAVAAAVGFAAPSWVVWAVVGLASLCLLAALGCVAVAARPRLVRQGHVVRVCLAPLTAYDLPLEIIECVFSGSSPLAAAAGISPEEDQADAGGGRRVGTVVMRLAERADSWRMRPTLSQWGRWSDGYIVFDGRWCEPLSSAFTRELSQRLLDAKREIAASASPPAADRPVAQAHGDA
jgi:hypothetical protein